MTAYRLDALAANALSRKDEFHRHARLLLKKLAEELGLSSAEYDLRSNKAGPAVSGEVTLHTDSLYVQVDDRSIMYRTCKGRRDCGGGTNNFAWHDALKDIPAFAARLRRMIAPAAPSADENDVLLSAGPRR